MTKFPSRMLARVLGLGLIGIAWSQSPSRGGVIVQGAGDVVGTGAEAWSYLRVEGEDFDSKSNEAADVGFARVDNSGTVKSFLNNPVLGPDTKASKEGALWTQTAFSAHVDKVTYKVQFAKPGTYYLYMRFTMFENGSNEANYLNEDSFFLPPDFGKDPQTDWPLSDRGGYTEGCCDAGFLTIKEAGQPVNHSAGDEAGRAYWEGNFHWNELSTSQFLTEAQGTARLRHKFEVTADQVGKPLDWTVSYREGGIAIDLWLFSTNPDLLGKYTQEELDTLLVQGPKITVQDPNDVVGTGAEAWSYLRVEGEDFDSKSNESADVGFARVDNSGTVKSFLNNPVLGTDTKASKKGALWTQTAFSAHVDKVTYKVQFVKPGTYYLYMRFTMFENGGNEANYLNEDSFFLPPDFGKDPQTDWPLSDRGGYTEGCCDAGFLTIKEAGQPVNHSAGDEAGRAYWEGNFHWNELSTSQFLTAEQGTARLRHKFEVTADQVGKTLDWTVSYREGGVTIDLWLFSTNPDLLGKYTQEELDTLLVPGESPKITVQDPNDVVGTGASAWSYLKVEGEDFNSKSNESADVGFARVDSSGTVKSFLNNPVLGPDTTASGKGALWTQTAFSAHVDKVTYKVQFVTPGTYYLYMRFTMFENGGNEANYLNEDSFFLPPDFGKDPQTDWPLSDRGGYTEGCCDAGFLTIKEAGQPVNHSAGDEAGRAYWEGNFHWNELSTSQFLTAEQGTARLRHKFEVTADQVGKTMDWTVSYREGGLTVDLWLFSTSPNLMDDYSQADLDHLLLGGSPLPRLTIARDAGRVVISWPVAIPGFQLEGTASLSTPSWSAVATTVVGDQNTVTVDPVGEAKFYRLRNP